MSIKKILLLVALIQFFGFGYTAEPLRTSVEEVAPGVFRIRAGEPEKIVPSMLKSEPKTDALEKMPKGKIPLDNIKVWQLSRGCRVELSVEAGELIYGLGLQGKNLVQNGWNKTLLSNASDNGKGAGHAPVPFYVSTAGYGVLIDNARFITFSVAEKQLLHNLNDIEYTVKSKENVTDIEQLYGKEMRGKTSIYADIPACKGVDIYLFSGPEPGDAIARYNLFSGGGFIPPIAGLGPEYLIGIMLKEKEAFTTCKDFKKEGIPITSIGLEPGWQTHAYSSSYIWNRENFSENFVQKINSLGYDVTLWCQLYLDPTCPLIPLLNKKFGDFDVWRGLIPDMTDVNVRNTYRDFLKDHFIKKGISGFKLDEVDGSFHEPAYQNWMFPVFTTFPSGAEGDQARNLLGRSGQKSIEEAYKQINKRTFSLVRASNAWAAPSPMALYTDEYNFADFVRYNLSAGVQGLLWSPEVRHADNERDWARRLATATFSAKMTINNWQFPNPAWRQPDLAENEKHNLLPADNPFADIARRFTRLRMALIPYIYTAFYKYYNTGISPVRPLVADYPKDINTHLIDDQWMLGDAILVAPLTDENSFSEYIKKEAGPQNSIADENVDISFKEDEINVQMPPTPVGLKGGKFELNLKKGSARLRFSAKGEISNLSIRLRPVKNGIELSDLGNLYKDNILINNGAWSVYDFKFDVPEDGQYALVFSKGYSVDLKHNIHIIFKSLCIEQFLGNGNASWERMVYLPEGGWRDFWSNTYYEGGKRYNMTATSEKPLVFVKDNTLLPLATPVLTVDDNTSFSVNLAGYGNNLKPCILFEDDGVSFNYEKGMYSKIEISSTGKINRAGDKNYGRFNIIEKIQDPEKVLHSVLNAE